MKKLSLLLLSLLCAPAFAQFTPGQVLTAAQLNSTFALYAPLAGSNFTGNVSIAGTLSGPGVSTLLGPYLTSATAASTYAPLNSPVFTGTPTVPGYLTTATASSTYAPIASPTFTGTVTIPSGASIAGYAPIASPTFTGTVTIPAGASISGYAPLASPTFTGTVTIPTASIAAGTVNATTLSSSGAFTPSQTAGIVGTNAVNNAAAGSVGEYAPNANTTGTSLTSNTATNVVSVGLTAGDWDVTGASLLVGSTTNLTQTICGLNTTSATQPGIGQYVQYAGPAINVGGSVVPTMRVSVAASVTAYLVCNVTYSSGSATGYGSIRARRVR